MTRYVASGIPETQLTPLSAALVRLLLLVIEHQATREVPKVRQASWHNQSVAAPLAGCILLLQLYYLVSLVAHPVALKISFGKRPIHGH